jgi:hypothetical protein
MKIVYDLIVGTNKASTFASRDSRQASRMLHLPLRIYNNVSGWPLLKFETNVLMIQQNRELDRFTT